jgi:hypothetical protein
MSESTYAADTVSAPAPVLSVSPVVLSAPSRAVDLQVRVSAPVTGSELPIILLSHGPVHETVALTRIARRGHQAGGSGQRSWPRQTIYQRTGVRRRRRENSSP